MSGRLRAYTQEWRRDPYAVFGFCVTALVLLVALAGVLGLTGDPEAMNAADKLRPPSWRHLFGTDNFGRDVFSRVLSGTASTVAVALGTILLGGTLGILLGSLAGYLGGMTELAVMRLSDTIFAFPVILLALVVVEIYGPGALNVVIALGIAFTPSFTRVVRGGMMQQKSAKYVELARVYGASPLRIMLVHILPNLAPTLLSAFTVGFANAILAETGMSYIGLGVQPPAASWGKMLADGWSYNARAPWMLVFPGVAIILGVMGFHALGESIRRHSGRER